MPDRTTTRAQRSAIIAGAFSLGLILGGVITGLFWSWPIWLVVVLAVSVLAQVVIWARWRRAMARPRRERE